MIEPHTEPIYPGDEPAEAVIAEAAAEGQVRGLRAGIELFLRCRTPQDVMLTHAALQRLLHPKAESVSAIAVRLGVSRKTIHQRINRLKKGMPWLS